MSARELIEAVQAGAAPETVLADAIDEAKLDKLKGFGAFPRWLRAAGESEAEFRRDCPGYAEAFGSTKAAAILIGSGRARATEAFDAGLKAAAPQYIGNKFYPTGGQRYQVLKVGSLRVLAMDHPGDGRMFLVRKEDQAALNRALMIVGADKAQAPTKWRPPRDVSVKTKKRVTDTLGIGWDEVYERPVRTMGAAAQRALEGVPERDLGRLFGGVRACFGQYDDLICSSHGGAEAINQWIESTKKRPKR